MKSLLCLALLFSLTAGLLPAAKPGSNSPPPLLRAAPPELDAPLVFKPGAATEMSYAEDELKWFEKHLVPAVAKAWVGQPWRDEALTFLRERLRLLQWRPLQENHPPGKVFAKTLTDAGCTDPWVRLLEVWDLNTEEDFAAIWNAFGEIRDSTLDPAIKRFAVLPLLMEKTNIPATEEWQERQGEVRSAFMGWTAALGKSVCYEGKDGDLLLRHLRQLPDITCKAEDLLPHLREAGGFPGWVMDTLEGEAQIKLAWDSRGTAFAAKVSDEQWQGFHYHLKLARKHLTAAWRARADLPQAAAEMIAVVMGGDAEEGENIRLWFDRSTAACFDYRGAFWRYNYALLPRWSGSYEMMTAFGEACLNTKRFDTGTPLVYTELLDAIAKERKDFRAVYRQPGVAEKVRILYEGMVAAAPTPQGKADRYAAQMVSYWLCGNWEAGFDLIDAFGFPHSPVMDDALGKLAVSRRKVSVDLVIFGGPGGATARRAEALMESGDAAESLKLWATWRQQYSGYGWVTEEAEKRVGAAVLRRDYAEGKWVTLPVDRPGDWDQPGGAWEQDGKSGLTTLGSGKDGFHCASYPLATGPHFEVRTKFKVTGPPLGENDTAPQLMVHTGFKPWSLYMSQNASAWLGAGGICGFIAADGTIDPVTEPVHLNNDPTETVEIYQRRTTKGLTLVINGKTIMEESDATAGSPDWEKGCLAVGAFNLKDGMRVAVTSLEARRLP